MLNIPIILATARKGRQSEKVAKYVYKKAREFGFKSKIVDVRKFRVLATDNTMTGKTAKEFEKIVLAADGFIIVSPEYNHGYPGELKMMLDLLWPQFNKKPVGFCGVSAGMWGGARGIQQLILMTAAFQMVYIGKDLHFPQVETLFNKNGEIKNKKYNQFTQDFLTEMSWFAHTLKQGKKL